MVAELAHLTVPAFCRYFKKMTGQTLTAFVQEYRINQACLLLLEDRPITEVSFATGFNQTFRRLTDLSPSAFRQQHFPHPHAGRGVRTPGNPALNRR